jgi:hypothetical protein
LHGFGQGAGHATGHGAGHGMGHGAAQGFGHGAHGAAHGPGHERHPGPVGQVVHPRVHVSYSSQEVAGRGMQPSPGHA